MNFIYFEIKIDQQVLDEMSFEGDFAEILVLDKMILLWDTTHCIDCVIKV